MTTKPGGNKLAKEIYYETSLRYCYYICFRFFRHFFLMPEKARRANRSIDFRLSAAKSLRLRSLRSLRSHLPSFT